VNAEFSCEPGPLRSPLEPLSSLGAQLDLELLCKRDDMLPYFYGGNKVRKIFGICREAETLGCNALVTTGGLHSNHARVTALAAAARGWRAVLVLHAEAGAAVSGGNALLARLAGAEIVLVEPSGIAVAMQEAMAALRRQSYTPFEIPGGGHCLSGSLGYVRAVHELAAQKELTGPPDYVIVASGTGTTQAGLMVGCEQLGWSTRVLGVSVARGRQRGEAVIDEACAELRGHLGVALTTRPTEFFDRWVGRGYEQVYPELLETMRRAALEGLILDPTYSGKAFQGLVSLVREGVIEAGARVVFWHTGGLINLLASPHREALLS
jgi:1-aminocyclopropane-1-carboxylate deaminase/D-cysteine desulfhydrase-like pyridoxal-dependent ACC family enzyme